MFVSFLKNKRNTNTKPDCTVSILVSIHMVGYETAKKNYLSGILSANLRVQMLYTTVICICSTLLIHFGLKIDKSKLISIFLLYLHCYFTLVPAVPR